MADETIESVPDWPLDANKYPESIKLLRLIFQMPRLFFKLVRFLFVADIKRELVFGVSSTNRYSKQRPSFYVSEKKAWRRWLRFLRECLFPTIFICRKEWAELNGYVVDGYYFSLHFWLLGKGWSFVAGRRGQPLYDDEPDCFPVYGGGFSTTGY